MSLNFLFSSKKQSLSPESKKLLDAYTAGAVKEIGNVKKIDAEIKASQYASDFYKSGKAESLTSADVKIAEKQIAKEMKQYGMKERLNYATDARPSKLESLLLKCAVLSVGGLASAATGNETGMATVTAGFALLAAQTAVRLAAFPKTDEQERKIDEYADLKHAQLALKQLKRELKIKEGLERDRRIDEKIDSYKKQVGQLFAAGYGQPSGGLIQAVNLKKQKEGR